MPETVRLYHFMRVEHALQAIERRRLKIAELDKVNDPFECLAIALNSRKDEEFFLSYQRDIAKEYGVVCFSETCQDPSLWGHYADRFRGICLGFDTAFHGDDEEDLIGKVNYVQKRIDTGKFRDLLTYFKSSNSQYDNNISTQIQTLMYTKSFNWAYEKEWRLWVEKMHQDPVTGLHFADFGPLVLREILIGFRCPKKT